MLQKREGAVRWARGKEARTWTSGHHRCGESPRSRPQGRTSTNAEAGDSDTLMRSHGFPEPTIDEHESIALVDALREQAGIIARATNTTASRAALAASQWSDHAPRRAALIEGAIEKARVNITPPWHGWESAEHWVRLVCEDAFEPDEDKLFEVEDALRDCHDAAEALAAKHIERRVREHVPVLNQMAKHRIARRRSDSMGSAGRATRRARHIARRNMGSARARAGVGRVLCARRDRDRRRSVPSRRRDPCGTSRTMGRPSRAASSAIGNHPHRRPQPGPARHTAADMALAACRSTTGSRRHARTLRLHKPRDRTMGSSLDAQARPQNEGTGGRRGIDRPDPAQRRSIVRAAYCGRFVSCTSLR